MGRFGRQLCPMPIPRSTILRPCLALALWAGLALGAVAPAAAADKPAPADEPGRYIVSYDTTGSDAVSSGDVAAPNSHTTILDLPDLIGAINHMGGAMHFAAVLLFGLRLGMLTSLLVCALAGAAWFLLLGSR